MGKRDHFSFFFDQMLNKMAGVAAFLIAYLSVSISVAVILREFKIEIIWMFEVTEYSLLWLTFLAAPWVLRDESHIKMDLILSTFSPKKQAFLNSLTSLIGTIICLILAFFGFKVTWDYFQTGYFLHTVMAPPIYPILIVIPLGFLMLFIQFIRRTVKYYKEWRSF